MSDERLADAVKGEVIAEGLIRISATVPLDHSIGNRTLEGLSHSPLLPGESSPLPAIYIDTETTGLSGGSGTVAFLVGIAQVTSTSLKLTQLLMTRYGAEATLLSELASLLPDTHRLVTYNGKSYDLPLLITRFRMQGMRPDFSAREHLDLLHPVRRLFNKQWPDCRLTTVEQKLLGFSREGDLPGSEAPEAWFAYVRAGFGEQLVRVVAHNRQDILSLAAIHQRLSQIIMAPGSHDIAPYPLGRWWADIDEQRAISYLRAHKATLCADGIRLLANLLRRQSEWAAAAALWEKLACDGCIESTERLAKYHEHVTKDIHTALKYCEKLPGTPEDTHRYKRLINKLR
ncbi:MAG TPA: ribonuclease H-like domain-containing protein [Gammaproteobacteria bacterium]